MVGKHNIWGLNISNVGLALRAVAGALLAALLFVPLSLLPMAARTILPELLPSEAGALTGALVALIHPALPFIGAAVALLSFLLVLLRGSRAYGPATIAFGLAFMAYILLAFSFGSPSLALPPDLAAQAVQQALGMPVEAGAELVAHADLTGLMLVLIAPFALTAIKGILITTSRRP